jgi:hypothetical protein
MKMSNNKPLVLFSSNDDPGYSNFAPLVTELWQELGFETYHIQIGEEPFFEIAGMETSLQAQISRIYAATMFHDRICLITDIDMLPLNKEYFWSKLPKNENEVSIYSYDAHAGSRYPMCYLAAYGKSFSSIVLDDEEESWERFAKRLDSMNLGWNTDELYITERIDQSDLIKIKHNRGWKNGLAHNRLDRSSWKETSDFYVDAHCPRPYDDNLRDLIKYLKKG